MTVAPECLRIRIVIIIIVVVKIDLYFIDNITLFMHIKM